MTFRGLQTAFPATGRHVREAPIPFGFAFAIAALLNACGYQIEPVKINENNLHELSVSIQGQVEKTGVEFRFHIDDGYLGDEDFWHVSQQDSESRGQDSVFLRTGSREDIRIELRSGSRTLYSRTIPLPDSNLIRNVQIDSGLSVTASWLYLPTEASNVTMQFDCTSISGSEYDQSIAFRRGSDRSRYLFDGGSSFGPQPEEPASGNLLLLDTSDVTQSHDDSTFSIRVDFSRPLRNWRAQVKGCDAHVAVYHTRYYPAEKVFQFEDISLFYSQRTTSSIRLDNGSPGE